MPKPMHSAVGIDIGGTKVSIAAVTSEGRIVAETTFPTHSRAGFPAGCAQIIRSVQHVVDQAGWRLSELDGIGIGCAGPVDPVRGTLHNPHTLPGWEEAPIVQQLSDRFQTAVRLENDADAALLGECRFGAGRGYDPVVMLTFGTGVGGGILSRGQVFRGAAGQHPELGHIPVSAGGPACYCGTTGCLESIASGTAIGAAGQAVGLTDARAVLTAAAQRHPAATAIVDRVTEALSIAIWTVVHLVLPQRIILGGGVMDEHYTLFQQRLNAVLALPTQVHRDSVFLSRAALGNQAGLVGAAALVFESSPQP